MSKFLKLLIHNMDTINGYRGTATTIKNQIFRKVCRSSKKRGNKLDEENQAKIRKQIDHDLMCQMYTRYNIMRVRMKLSFSCFMKNMPLNELWMKQILLSFKFLQKTGQIPITYLSKEEDDLFKSI